MKRKKHSFLKILAMFLLVFAVVCMGDMYYKNADKAEKQITARELVLVNYENKLPDGFEVNPVTLTNGEKVDSEMYPFLQEMFDDMRAEGYYPQVVSGYRSRKEQKKVFENKYFSFLDEGYSKSKARKLTEEWVALPGKSEHETGLAVDINPDREKSGDEVYEWLKNNAHKYGFINRYPSDKTEITGIAHERWHYRFVGLEAAEEIYRKNLCLEEYIEKIS